MLKCPWAYLSPEMEAYHDKEWGKPLYDERALFELLCLEQLQAGLSWQTVLKKRPAFKEALANFEVAKLANFDEGDLAQLLANPALIRNRRKLEAILANARLIYDQQLSLAKLCWAYVDEKPLINHWQSSEQVPAQTDLASQMAKDLKRLGFKFVGPTTIYSFMQASGMVNDHLESCPCKEA